MSASEKGLPEEVACLEEQEQQAREALERVQRQIAERKAKEAAEEAQRTAEEERRVAEEKEKIARQELVEKAAKSWSLSFDVEVYRPQPRKKGEEDTEEEKEIRETMRKRIQTFRAAFPGEEVRIRSRFCGTRSMIEDILSADDMPYRDDFDDTPFDGTRLLSHCWDCSMLVEVFSQGRTGDPYMEEYYYCGACPRCGAEQDAWCDTSNPPEKGSGNEGWDEHPAHCGFVVLP